MKNYSISFRPIAFLFMSILSYLLLKLTSIPPIPWIILTMSFIFSIDIKEVTQDD